MDETSIRRLMDTMPYAAHLGIVLDAATAEEVVGHLDWSESLCTAAGIVHGGALMSLADTVGAVCAVLSLPEGAGTATAASSTYLMRAVPEGAVHARSRPLHRGRSSIVVQTDLTDHAGRLVAQTTQTQAVLGGR